MNKAPKANWSVLSKARPSAVLVLSLVLFLGLKVEEINRKIDSLQNQIELLKRAGH